MASFIYNSVGPEFFNQLLSRAFQFNYPDLVKNRDGRLTREQLLGMLWRAVTPLVRAFVGCIVLFAAYVLLARTIGQGNWMSALQVTMLLAIGAGFVRFSIHAALLIGDLRRGGVAMVEGRLEPSWDTARAAVNRHETGSRTVTKHRFAVGDEFFNVPESAFRILVDNFEAGLPTVRVYYTPSSRTILSIEAFSVEPLVLRPAQMKKLTPASIWKS